MEDSNPTTARGSPQQTTLAWIEARASSIVELLAIERTNCKVCGLDASTARRSWT